MMMIRVLFQKHKHIEGPTLPHFGKVGQFYYGIYISIYNHTAVFILNVCIIPIHLLYAVDNKGRFIFSMCCFWSGCSTTVCGSRSNHLGSDVFHVCFLVRYSDKTPISNRCILGLMPNLIKKSWTVSNSGLLRVCQKLS